jgi:tRNA (guanine-N7-)-methyltransferase
MENAVRTAAYRDCLEQRRSVAHAELSKLLSGPADFVWEVGCGHGHFLTAYAAVHPTQLCIGVDIELDRIERAQRKQSRSNLRNLHFIRADARLFLDSLPPEARFTAIYILFPDPWPKRRHHKHRLLGADFLQRVAERAAPGTRLYFRTDHEPYFLDVEAVIACHPAWRIVDEPWLFDAETVFQARAPSFRSLVAQRR